MDALNDVQQALQSLKAYLQELLETGVDGLPLLSAAEAERIHKSSTMEYPEQEEEPLCGIVADVSMEISANVNSDVDRNVGGQTEALADIRSELDACIRCSLGASRTNLVFGTGNQKARLVFVGEAPGRDEDLQGIPFVGKAGELLTNMIVRMGMSRDDVYICNVLKCRPPNNRNPLPSEIDRCQPYLLRQLRVIGPEVIVALGTFAAQTLLATKEPISKLRGRFHEYHGIPLMPTFHPSFLLRNGPDLRWVVWEDMMKVLELLGMPVPDIKRKGRT
jgi:uracil-DNA glycosylase family 4